MAGAAGPVGGHLLLGGSRQGIFSAAVSAVLSPRPQPCGVVMRYTSSARRAFDAELAAVDEAHLEHLLADGPCWRAALGYARGLPVVPDVFVQRVTTEGEDCA